MSAYRGILFQREIAEGAANDDHRITLFKRVGWYWKGRWPWTGWLVPAERSGETTLESNSAFRAPDRSSDAEGVAGKAFNVEIFEKIESLPDLCSESVSEEDWQSYADATFCEVRYLKQRKPAARSYIGFLIRVKGKRWGAVVIDSSTPTISVDDAVLGQLRTVLGIVLE